MAEATPLDELQWSSPEWIQSFGLNSYNVLEYFSQSPFYDRTSNNQVLKMQFQYNENLINLPQSHPMFINSLQKMTGVEFVILINNEPHFYIVRKQFRTSPTRTKILNDYYIINSNIYMSPNLFSILNSRVLNCTLNFKKSFNLLNNLNNFNSSNGHQYVVNDTLKNINELEQKISHINNKDPPNETTDGKGVGGLLMKRRDTSVNTPGSLNPTPNSTNTPNISTSATVNNNSSVNLNRAGQQPSVIFDRLLNITMKEIKSKDPDFGNELATEEVSN